MEASKTGSGWKIVMPGLNHLDFPASMKHMDLLISNLKRGTKGVKAGEIKNRAEAQKKVEKDVPKSIPGNVPMPRFLTQGG